MADSLVTVPWVAATITITITIIIEHRFALAHALRERVETWSARLQRCAPISNTSIGRSLCFDDSLAGQPLERLGYLARLSSVAA
jgi:hypothetical protein